MSLPVEIQLLQPIWLLVLLALPLTWLLERGSFSALGRLQRRFATVLRSLLLILIALALCGFQTRDPNAHRQVIYLLDASLSVQPAELEAATEYVRTAVASIDEREAERTESAVMVFGRTASFEHSFSHTLELGELLSVVEEEYTDIARAMQHAAATFDPGAEKRIVLISDGRENVGDSAETARRLRQQGISVDTVNFSAERADEVVARKVILPSKADRNETFQIGAVIESSVETDATLKLYRQNTYWGEVPVHLTPGRNVIPIKQTEDDSGFYTYEFEIEAPGDPIGANNRARSFTVVQGEPKILYLTGDPKEHPDLASMLAGKNIQMDFRQTAYLPHNLTDLLSWDAIFFSDVSAETLTPDQQELIQGYVRAMGKGFVMLGGDQSFGVGGWYQSTVEEVLPVNMDFKRQQHFPSTALGIVIDRSGSMAEMSGGYTKLDLAKKAAVESGTLLTNRDYIGVVAFDTAHYWITDKFQKMTSKSRLRAQVGSITLGGGTNIYAGMRPTVDELMQSPAQVKHIILLTDGMSAPGDYDGLIRDCRRADITITCVATGPDSNEPFLKDFAEQGGGRYYPLKDARNLPRIFTKETFLAATKSVIEEPFYAQAKDSHPIVEGFPFAASQPLIGYNATSPKDAAVVSMVTPQGDPLLAHWNYGLGKSIAFTSDAKNRWAAAWMGWAPAQGLWTQAVRWLVGEQDTQELIANVSREGTQTTISVDSFSPAGDLDAQGTLTAYVVTPGPDSEIKEVPLRQVAPGRYELSEEFAQVGSYAVTVVKEIDGEVVGALRTGFAVSYSPEYEAGRPNTFLLNQIADTTLGRHMPLPEEAYRPVETAVEGFAWKDWTLPLLVLAVLLFPLDIAVRRIMLPEDGIRDWTAAVIAGLIGAVRPKRQQAQVAFASGRRAVRTAWQMKAEQSVREEGRRSPGDASVPSTQAPQSPAISHEAKSGDLQSRVERILAGSGTQTATKPEDDTYQKLLAAKRRATRGPNPKDN